MPGRHRDPIIDLSLLKIPTFSLAAVGGSIFRIGMGAMQLLLPLMLQLGFGLSPFASGLLTFAGAAGSMPMKVAAPFMLRTFGFRKALVGGGLINGVMLIGYGFFTPDTPHLLMFMVILTSGFVRSLQFTARQCHYLCRYFVAGYEPRDELFQHGSSNFPRASESRPAPLSFMRSWRSEGQYDLSASDFSVAFMILGIITLFSGVYFLMLSPQAGSEVSGTAKTVNP